MHLEYKTKFVQNYKLKKNGELRGFQLRDTKYYLFMINVDKIFSLDLLEETKGLFLQVTW